MGGSGLEDGGSVSVRKKGLGFLLVLAAIIGGILLLINDRLIEWAMEKAGTAVVGAKVEFDGVEFSITKVQLKWDRLQVTNPTDTWRNMLETRFAELDLALEPLFVKRFIVENMNLDSIRFDTRRRRNGAVPGKSPSSLGVVGRVRNRIESEFEALPAYRLLGRDDVNVDSIMRVLDLRTPGLIDSLRSQIDSLSSLWGDRAESPPGVEDLERIRDSLERINPQKLESPQEIANALAILSAVTERIDSLQKVYDGLAKEVRLDAQRVRAYDDRLGESIVGDYDRALRLAQLPEFTTAEVVRAVFGPALADKILTVLTYVGTARYYGEKIEKTSPPKREKPPRLSGQNIRYSAAREWPSFWVQSAGVSAIVAGIFGSGSLQDLATRQELTGRPTRLTLSGAKETGEELALNALLDYTEDIPLEDIDLNLQNVSFTGVEFLESAMPSFGIEGRGGLGGNFRFRGDSLGLEMNITILNPSLAMLDNNGEGIDAQLATFLKDAVEALSSLSLGANLRRTDQDFSLDFSSNVADALAARLREFAQGKLEEAKSEIRGRIEDKTVDERKAFSEDLTQTAQLLEAVAGDLEERIDGLDDIVGEKRSALEKKAGEEAEGKAKEEVEKRLKDLF